MALSQRAPGSSLLLFEKSAAGAVFLGSGRTPSHSSDWPCAKQKLAWVKQGAVNSSACEHLSKNGGDGASSCLRTREYLRCLQAGHHPRLQRKGHGLVHQPSDEAARARPCATSGGKNIGLDTKFAMYQMRAMTTKNVAPGLSADMTTPKGHTHKENRNRMAGSGYFNMQGAAFTFVGGLGLYWFLDYMSKNMARRQRAAIVEQESIGTPKLGGPWSLYDRNGNLVTDHDFRGKYQLIYFGFSFCPDICPEEMEKQGMVIEKLDKMFGKDIVEPIFITVDPARDTVAQVDSYCSEFHPRLRGLTGTPEQVKKVTRAFRVYYNEGIRADGDDYLVDHSIIQYFMDRNGNFVDFFGKNMTVGEIVSKIAAKIQTDEGKLQNKKYSAG
ncbi:unnamed protein product [Amoebophrya sp. A25]|nr:unnamed protein product [Amoebophrya sp. A25]|eukprot:GSA25T00013681001.1